MCKTEPGSGWSDGPPHHLCGSGGNVLDRPTEIKTSGWDSNKDTTITLDRPSPQSDVGGTNRQPGPPGGGGGWRVLLVDSEKHVEKRVVQALTRVIPNCDENHAKVGPQWFH